MPVGGGRRPARSPMAPPLPPRRRGGAHLGAQGPPSRASRGLLRQAPQGTARARRPRPLPRLLRPGPGPPARPRLPRRVRGGAPVPRGEAAHGRPDPPASPLHAGVARGGAHAGARLDPRLRARGGGAPAGPLRREDARSATTPRSRTAGIWWRRGCPMRWGRAGASAARPRFAGWSVDTWAGPRGARCAGSPGSSACRRRRCGSPSPPSRGRETRGPASPGCRRDWVVHRAAPGGPDGGQDGEDGPARRIPLHRRPHASPPAPALRRDPAVVRRALGLEPQAAPPSRTTWWPPSARPASSASRSSRTLTVRGCPGS